MKSTLHIGVALQKSSTYLKKAYCTTPFKVMNITEDKKAEALQLMLMSSSPGILDGDQYDLKIELEKGTSLELYTQAYQRLFFMKQGASQQMTVRMAEGSSFYFLPHPTVPHAQSVFTSHNDFYITDHCRLLFGELLTCGRKLNGEAFLFSKYQSLSNFYHHDRLMIKENLLIYPSRIDVQAIGQLEGFSHQASLIILDQPSAIHRLLPSLKDFLSSCENILVGYTQLPMSGLMIRLLGHGAEQLFDCMKTIGGLVKTNSSKTANALIEPFLS